MHKSTHTHTHNEILFSHKKWEISSMNGPGVHNGQWNMVDTERERLYCLTYMWYLEKPNL